LASSSPTGASAEAAPVRPFVRAWTMAELEGSLADLGRADRDARRGAALFRELACVQCHKVDGQPGGGVGPDLAEIWREVASGELKPLDVLTEILEPSKEIEEEYRTNVLALSSGEVVSGIVVD